MTVKRHCAGYYTVTDSSRSVTVSKMDVPNWRSYWMAVADWDRYLYSDPCANYRDAKAVAVQMLENSRNVY